MQAMHKQEHEGSKVHPIAGGVVVFCVHEGPSLTMNHLY